MKRTPRQELIEAAALRAQNGCDAHAALEAIVGACRIYPAGTMGAEIVSYYRGVSENGLTRLIKKVQDEICTQVH